MKCIIEAACLDCLKQLGLLCDNVQTAVFGPCCGICLLKLSWLSVSRWKYALGIMITDTMSQNTGKRKLLMIERNVYLGIILVGDRYWIAQVVVREQLKAGNKCGGYKMFVNGRKLIHIVEQLLTLVENQQQRNH